MAPDCKAPKKDKKQHANAAQEIQGNEIACSAIDVFMEDTDIDSISSFEPLTIITDNHDGATEEVSNMLFIKDAGFIFYLLNDLFVSMYFEAFEFFTNSEDARVPDIHCCVHNKPLSKLHLDFAKIIHINLTKDKDEIWQMLEHEMIQVIKAVFNDVNPIGSPLENWSTAVYSRLICKIMSLQSDLNVKHCIVILASNDEGLQLTFYPLWADSSIINYDIMVEQYFISHMIKNGTITARAASASDKEVKEGNAKANVVRHKDPGLEELGDPRDLHNYLLDSGATQHMTPRLADLEDVVEGRKLGVEVVDGHIIKCPATGKIRISMIDDDRNPIEAKLHDVMYIPGLNRRLFSITRFARHGHYAVFRNATTTLHFAPSWARVSLLTSHRDQAFVANSTVTEHESNEKQIPEQRNRFKALTFGVGPCSLRAQQVQDSPRSK